VGLVAGNALGFSLNFDPAILGNPRAAIGSDTAGAILNVNSSQVTQGRLGIALALPSGQRFALGARQVAVITFNVANTNAASTRVDFGDAPISRQVSNANAQLLNAGYQSCTLIIDNIPPGYEADVTPRPSGKNIGFSLNFDPNIVRYVSATAGDGMTDGFLIINANQIDAERVGIAIALPAGKKVAEGKRNVVNVRFTSLASSTAATTTIAFDDRPIRRQISDVDANGLTAEYINGSVTIRNAIANVSAASFKADLAAESIVAAFGSAMATTIAVATELPLPTALAGTSVKVKDSAGVERLAPLFFVAPTQVNYLMPKGTVTGLATVTITSGDGASSSGTVNLTNVAPSIFSANADGQGVATATVLRVKADGSQIYEPVSRYDDVQKKFVAAPIDLGPENDQVILILFGTGLRNRSSLGAASVIIGGLPAPVRYVGPQGAFAGVDQINLRLPRSLG
jgi:uncharacterized protein (TIGR03437 family)